MSKMSTKEIIDSKLSEIESMAERGFTEKEISEKLGIGYSTFRKHKRENVALKEAIATGKDKLNQEVEKSLFKKAIGYKYSEEIVTKVKEEVLAEDGNTILVKEKVIISPVKKYSPPDLGAQKFWLKNKEKEKWKEDPHQVNNNKKLTKLKEKEVNAKIIDI